MPRKKPTAKIELKERVLPIAWRFPENLVSGYATNILVQTGENELYVSFFETPPPVLLGPEDIKKLEGVTAECVARIIISPDRLPRFIEVLQKQLDVFNKKKAAKKINGSK